MKLFVAFLLGLLVMSSGCTYYRVAPGGSVSKFDRAFSTLSIKIVCV